MTDSALHRFDRDTAVSLAEASESCGETVHVFDARIDEGWWIAAGPNGGYLAALLLRAMVETESDASREPRTQTTHFTARAVAGPARVTTRVLRRGRSLSTVTARLEQEGRLIAYSLAALGTARDGVALSFQDVSMPEVPPPEKVDAAPHVPGLPLAFGERYEKRPVFASAEPGPQARATSGGWIRPVPDRAGDALLVTALADAWPPAVFQKVPPGPGTRGVPTVELTVHFRAPDVAARIAPGAWYLVRFGTDVSRDGFVDESGEIWSRDGVLLAESRQLALLA